MIKVGIVGSAGYVAGELVRCLVHHSHVSIDFMYSTSQAGKPVFEVHGDLFDQKELYFTNQVNLSVDVVFLCLGHGNSSQFLSENIFSKDTVIIDMSNDFRLQKNAEYQGRNYIYGLVELNKEAIINARSIANPGCFATAIQLGILPLAKANAIQKDIAVHAITGSTGAGQSLSSTSHFSWRNNNISIYKPFAHQHMGEILQSVQSLQDSFNQEINFLPIRGGFTRGIFASIFMQCTLDQNELLDLYKDFYKDAIFTTISTQTIDLKQVVNTNYSLIQVQKIDDKVLISSAIDNLLKGAAGQAIQNMNLIFGLSESEGLNLKASYF